MLLKWVLPHEREPDYERALRIREAWLEERLHIIVPSLWIYEVGNLLGRMVPQQAPQTLAALLEYEMVEAPMTPDLCRGTCDLMDRYAVTFYDAVYHAVAIEEQGLLITADEAYVAKTKKAGQLQLLSETEI